MLPAPVGILLVAGGLCLPSVSEAAAPASPVGDFLRGVLPAPLGSAAAFAAGLSATMAFASLMAMILVWMERKVCARFQARLGPTRVGPYGLLQPLADGIKLLFKEGLRLKASDPLVFYLAPFLPLVASFLILAVLPFGPSLQAVDVDAGVLYVAAVSGLGVLGVLIGGWGANSKYSLLGAMRSGAQLFSYELSLVLAMLIPVTASGHASLRGIVLSQAGGVWDWWIFKLPGAGLVAFLVFVVSSTAELNRGPFDLSEAESELTGGFHTEYSGMGFSLFFLAEYINLFVAAALGATLFLGGFLPPGIGVSAVDGVLNLVPGPVWLMLKSFGLIFVYMWLRWSLPRLRIDHLLALEWKGLLPVSMANLALASFLVALGWMLP